MQRSEAIGIGVAVIAHVVLFGLLSAGFLSTPIPEKPKQAPIEVSLVDKVGLQAQAPTAVQPPSESKAPDQGPPEDAAAAAKPEAEPDPVPPAPEPEAAPPPKPAPEAKPKPKKTVAPTPDKAKTPPKRDATAKSKAASDAKATGSDTASNKKHARGFNIDDVLEDGLSTKPSKTKSKAAPAAVMNSQTLADITSAITRQIQPCADKQVIPGPGANQIAVKLNLRFSSDGRLSATPRMVGSPSGVDDDNGRYVQRVVDLGVAALRECSPLRLPAEYYQTSAGGWNNINFTWQLKH